MEIFSSDSKKLSKLENVKRNLTSLVQTIPKRQETVDERSSSSNPDNPFGFRPASEMFAPFVSTGPSPFSTSTQKPNQPVGSPVPVHTPMQMHVPVHSPLHSLPSDAEPSLKDILAAIKDQSTKMAIKDDFESTVIIPISMPKRVGHRRIPRSCAQWSPLHTTLLSEYHDTHYKCTGTIRPKFWWLLYHRSCIHEG